MSEDRKTDEPLYADERHEQILLLVTKNGKIRTTELTTIFGVSEATLRKDLAMLELRGLLKRTHGGAIAISAPLERELASRTALNAEAKQAIAQACLAEIEDGATLYLDDGTTVLEIARLLVQVGRRVSILTNSFVVADMVADAPHIVHVLLGGHLRRIGRAISGPLAIDNLNRFTIMLAFMGVRGVTESGITVADLGEAQLKATVIARAQRVIVPADHTKFGVSDFVHVCDLEDIDVVVTDEADDHIHKMCDSHGVRLIVAPHS